MLSPIWAFGGLVVGVLILWGIFGWGGCDNDRGRRGRGFYGGPGGPNFHGQQFLGAGDPCNPCAPPVPICEPVCGQEVTIRGTQGCAGATGPPGCPGATGPMGPPGRQGNPGCQGASVRGPMGPPGGCGPMGPPGRPGQSVMGPRGPPGACGGPGEPGRRGKKGDSGPSGARGARGRTGGNGEPGRRGEKGDCGGRGERGKPGERGLDGCAGRTGPSGPEFCFSFGSNLNATTGTGVGALAVVPFPTTTSLPVGPYRGVTQTSTGLRLDKGTWLVFADVNATASTGTSATFVLQAVDGKTETVYTYAAFGSSQASNSTDIVNASLNGVFVIIKHNGTTLQIANTSVGSVVLTVPAPASTPGTPIPTSAQLSVLRIATDTDHPCNCNC